MADEEFQTVCLCKEYQAGKPEFRVCQVNPRNDVGNHSPDHADILVQAMEKSR